MLGGCELHGQTREQVLAAWRHPKTIAALEAGAPALVYCACCDGPALAEMRQAFETAPDGTVSDMLPGGVSRPVTCVRCLVETLEQAVGIMRRLNASLPIPR